MPLDFSVFERGRILTATVVDDIFLIFSESSVEYFADLDYTTLCVGTVVSPKSKIMRLAGLHFDN